MTSLIHYSSQEEANIQLVSENGWHLGTLEDEWRKNARVVEAAVRENGIAIGFAPFFQNNRSMAIIALENTELAYYYLHPDLQKDRVIKSLADRYLPQKLPEDFGSPDIHAIQNTKMVISHFFFINPARRPLLQELENEFSVLKKQGYYNETIHLNLECPRGYIYVRDARVSLFSGKQLIPRSPKSFKVWKAKDSKWRMIFPFGANFQSFSGLGCSPSNTRKAIMVSCKYALPYERASNMIEGGNCIPFIDEGVKKVLVGERALYLSYYGLKEDGFFDNLDLPDLSTPSYDALRMARNLNIFKEIKKLQQEKENQKASSEELFRITEKLKFYENMCFAPLSEKDKIQFYEQAQFLEARLNITKNKMAEELEIPPENLILLPQTSFHIDMHVFITPQGEIILHSNEKTIQFLQSIKESTSHESKQFINGYLETAITNEELFYEIEEAQETVLQKHNLRYRTLPLVFSIPEVSELNYSNGIFLEKGLITHAFISEEETIPIRLPAEGYTFLTTGPTTEAELPVHRKFVELFERTLGCRFRGVPGMSKQIATNSGGVHCLTFELFKIMNAHV